MEVMPRVSKAVTLTITMIILLCMRVTMVSSDCACDSILSTHSRAHVCVYVVRTCGWDSGVSILRVLERSGQLH